MVELPHVTAPVWIRSRLPVFALALMGLSLGAARPVRAEPELDATRLARLRAEVDELQERLDRARSAAGSERRSLQTQKADLEVLLNKEQLRQNTLKRMRARQLDEKRRAESRSALLVEPALAAAQRLRRLVEQTLPFRREQRHQAVDEIIESLRGPAADPAIAISRLWQLLEDEIRLTAESGLHRQVIVLDGRRLLVEVVHLGMGALYFRTQDGRFGWADAGGGKGYTFRLFSDEQRIAAVEALFDALRKQIRRGAFELPLALTSSGEEAP